MDPAFQNKELFTENLLKWHKTHYRPMPWKGEKDRYLIWLSEIILQQTRVEQGLPYFEKFKSKYPTVVDLANAPEDEVMKLWEGLGYYSRARNLHAAAKFITEDLRGFLKSKEGIHCVNRQVSGEDLRPIYDLAREIVENLQILLSERRFKINQRKQLKTKNKELMILKNQQLAKTITKQNHKLIQELTTQIKAIEKQIKALIISDDRLRTLHQQLISIPGVGDILCWNMSSSDIRYDFGLGKKQ